MEHNQLDFIRCLNSHFALWSLLMTKLLKVNTRRILWAPSQTRCIVSVTRMARYVCAVLAGGSALQGAKRESLSELLQGLL